ncbi:MAG: hypothetical protein ACJ74Y_04155, partial [Bryobacteraceae bacterium]
MSSRKNFDTLRFTFKAARLIAAFTFAASLVYADVSPEAGAFFFKQYLPEEYGADAQNWAVVQDARGIMFFGNTEGLLEYDGARWTHIQLPNPGSIVRSLGVNASGTVFVGGQNEFGFLKENANGILQYVSLLDRIPASDRNFGDIWTICATRTGMFFGSSSRIFRWSPESGMAIWQAPTRFGRLFTADDLPYVLVNGSGLHRISGGYLELIPGGSQRQASGDKLEPVPGGEQFPRQIRGVFSFAGSLMLATPNALYRQQGNKFVQFSTDADELLKKAEIYVCSPLNNGDLAVGTIQGGLVLITPAGRVEKIINKQTGLASNYVNAIYNDRAGSVWLALNLGIAHIDSQLPLTRFADRQGVDEAVAAIQRHAGTLYAGTLSGLTKLVAGPGAHFEPVSGIKGGVLSLLSTPDGLLIASQYGIWNLSANGLEVIFLDQTTFALAQSIRDPHLYYAAGRYGMLVLRSDGGRWKKIRNVPSDNLDFLSVVEDLDGMIWATTPRSILRINLSSSPAKIQSFPLESGAVGGWNYAYRIGGNVVFATGKGLRRFDTGSGHLVAETRFGNMFADGSRDVIRIAETSAASIWISGRSYNGVLRPSRTGGYNWDEHPLERAGIKELGALFIDPNEVAWASGASGGLVRYSGSNSSGRAPEFQAFLSAIQLLRNSQAISTATTAPTKVPHQQNSMRFDYSAPAFEDETRTEFQVHLDGLDHAWSEWSKETRKEYTNLWEGKYTLKVRARDLHGRISKEASFGFRVLPPWYRTIWAYLIYVPILLGSMMLFLKWRTHALKERNRKLEVIIEKRTEEIRQQRDEIKREEERTEALLLNILPAPVAHELRATG